MEVCPYCGDTFHDVAAHLARSFQTKDHMDIASNETKLVESAVGLLDELRGLIKDIRAALARAQKAGKL
jgi:hypothetical protein